MKVVLVIAALLLGITTAQAGPNVRGYVSPGGGVYLEFGNPTVVRPYRRRKCRTHTHWRGGWSMTHRHCIPAHRSWKKHRRSGHSRYY